MHSFLKKIFPESVLLYVVAGIAIAAFIFLFLGIEKIDTSESDDFLGVSMYPTLDFGDRYILVKYFSLKRYSIVVLNDPDSDDCLLVKRIVGLPGETIEIRRGQIFVNNTPLGEPYIKNVRQRGVENNTRFSIGADFYYILGDNRDRSYDSRDFGPIHKKHILGKIAAVIWPPQHVRWLW